MSIAFESLTDARRSKHVTFQLLQKQINSADLVPPLRVEYVELSGVQVRILHCFTLASCVTVRFAESARACESHAPLAARLHSAGEPSTVQAHWQRHRGRRAVLQDRTRRNGRCQEDSIGHGARAAAVAARGWVGPAIVNAWPVIVCSSIVVSQSHMCAGAAHVPAAAPEHNQRRGHLLAVGHPGGAKGQRDEAAAIQRRPHLRAHAVLPC